MAKSGEVIKVCIAGVSAIVGQAPWIVSIMGYYPLSLYQPSIYHGSEGFLIVPLMAGVVATLAVLRTIKALYVVVPVFFVLAAIVYWIYKSFGPLSQMHQINWIFSYCLSALLVAALAALVIHAK
jgi:hypothetical protein